MTMMLGPLQAEWLNRLQLFRIWYDICNVEYSLNDILDPGRTARQCTMIWVGQLYSALHSNDQCSSFSNCKDKQTDLDWYCLHIPERPCTSGIYAQNMKPIIHNLNNNLLFKGYTPVKYRSFFILYKDAPSNFTNFCQSGLKIIP